MNILNMHQPSQWQYADNHVTEKMQNPDHEVFEIVPTLPESDYDLFKAALRLKDYTILGSLIRRYTVLEFDKCESCSLALQESFPGLNVDDLLDVERYLIAGNDHEIGKAIYREIEKALITQGEDLYQIEVDHGRI